MAIRLTLIWGEHSNSRGLKQHFRAFRNGFEQAFFVKNFQFYIIMKHKFLFLLPFVLPVFAMYSCNSTTQESEKTATSDTITIDSLEHLGGYLVTISGCNDCHSPKIFGPAGPQLQPGKILSGYPAERPAPAFPKKMVSDGFVVVNADMTLAMGPWGSSFSANITSDATGIGNWSYKQFETAIRHGKFKGQEDGRQLVPPMPWQNFKVLKDNDVKAIFAYLKSTKPVKNIVPGYIPLKR